MRHALLSSLLTVCVLSEISANNDRPEFIQMKQDYDEQFCLQAFAEFNNLFINTWAQTLPNINSETKVILIGDSNVDNWDDSAYCGESGESCSPNIPRSENFGIGGATCQQLVFVSSVMIGAGIAEGRDWIVLHCGQNDMEFGQCGVDSFLPVTAADAFERVREVLSNMLTGTDIRVLFPGGALYPEALDIWTDFESYDNQIAQYAVELVRQSPTLSPRLVAIDTIGALREMGDPQTVFDEDGIHFSPEGYALWHHWIKTALTATGTDADCIVWKNAVCQVHAIDFMPTPTPTPTRPCFAISPVATNLWCSQTCNHAGVQSCDPSLCRCGAQPPTPSAAPGCVWIAPVPPGAQGQHNLWCTQNCRHPGASFCPSQCRC